MQADNTQKVIEEIIYNMNEKSTVPCTNSACAYCNGKCARKICGGYMSNKVTK